LDPPAVEKLYRALQEAKLRAPGTDCLAPIGAEAILGGLLKGIKAEFYTASTRPPAVYRGNPFQIEVGFAFGGQLGGAGEESSGSNGQGEPVQARVIRFANRVPLLYQQSACCTVKSVMDTKWNNYGLSQPRGSLPQAPLVILVHMASVWVPFTSESKEAIADYDEIRNQIKLGLAECGRRLGIYLRRKKKRSAYTQRRDVLHRYIDEVVESCRAMTTFNKDEFRRALIQLAESATLAADIEFDEHGKVIQRKGRGDMEMENTVVVGVGEPGAERAAEGQLELFDDQSDRPARARRKPKKQTRRRRS
jgi:DNA topoisomerase-6 subunit B